ncbi:hypothetical protein [Actinomycetospora cinnamomea]|uniref:Uncharacterized protein n=1 Tax=Actinomycetospora cinnamomea TaxID=663609 RepID=A0A2U1FRQ0_9PSEU|nr:hypothetical protein [Actinomycetospora cinnamomea]PVZ14881.1 hypothetical protein C8D89_101749 [Actinomycetospora cinnamomea]
MGHGLGLLPASVGELGATSGHPATAGTATTRTHTPACTVHAPARVGPPLASSRLAGHLLGGARRVSVVPVALRVVEPGAGG